MGSASNYVGHVAGNAGAYGRKIWLDISLWCHRRDIENSPAKRSLQSDLGFADFFLERTFNVDIIFDIAFSIKVSYGSVELGVRLWLQAQEHS